MTHMPPCWGSKLVRFSVRTKKLPISQEIGSFFIRCDQFLRVGITDAQIAVGQVDRVHFAFRQSPPADTQAEIPLLAVAALLRIAVAPEHTAALSHRKGLAVLHARHRPFIGHLCPRRRHERVVPSVGKGVTQHLVLGVYPLDEHTAIVL